MSHSTTTTAAVTDPVCGMTFEPAKAVGSLRFGGQTYHFCSRGCETKFDDAPEKFAGTPAAPAVSASCCASSRSCN